MLQLDHKAQDQDDSRFWAVLFGVDGDLRYPLHGCVSDAELTEKYLIEDLGVPSDHIRRLLSLTGRETTDGSTSPTCANIFKTPYSIVDNADILPTTSSSILREMARSTMPKNIVVAGCLWKYLSHQSGLSMHCVPWTTPLGTTTGPKSSTSAFERSKPFPPKSLSKRATRSRSSSIADTRVRESEVFFQSEFCNMFPLLRHAIEPMLEAAHDWQLDTSSYVVWAACRKNEYAREEDDDEDITHGILTKSLVDSSRSGRGSTYVDLVAGLPKWLYQMPFVAGDHKGQPIWYQE